MRVRAQRMFEHRFAPYIVMAVVVFGIAVVVIPRIAGLPGFAD